MHQNNKYRTVDYLGLNYMLSMVITDWLKYWFLTVNIK